MAVLEAWNGQAGTINAGGNTATLIHFASTGVNIWAGCTITFDAGTATVALRNQSSVVSSNTLADATMVGGGFPAAASVGDTFVVRLTPVTSPSFSVNADIGGGPVASTVFAVAGPTQIRTTKYTNGATVRENWSKVGSDTPVIWNLHAIAGPVVSFQLFPAALNLVAGIVGGNLLILMPPTASIFAIINGDWANRVELSVGLSGTAPPVGFSTFDGTQTSVADNAAIVMPPGLQTVPGANHRFSLGTGSTVYIKPGCHLIGTFDARSKSLCSITGYGNWAGTGIGGGAGVVQTLPFVDGAMFAMFLGSTPDGTGPASEAQVFGNSIVGPCMVDPPQFWNFGGLHVMTDVLLLSPWWGGAGGVGLVLDYHTGTASFGRAISTNADDHWQTELNGGTIDIFNVAFVHSTNAVFRFSYWPDSHPPYPQNARHLANACWVTSIALADQGWANILAPGNPVIGIMLAGLIGQDTWSVENRSVTDLVIEGDLACSPLEIVNQTYPFTGVAPGDKRGQAFNLNFTGITCTGVVSKRSRIVGLDPINTGHDVTLGNWTLGGVRVTPANYSTYFEQNEFPYNIRLDGVDVGAVLNDADNLWAATKLNYATAGLTSLTNISDRSASSPNDTAGRSAAQHVLDLWLMHAQIAFDITSAPHVAVATQGVIAVLWRRGGSSTQIEQIKWDTVFGDDGLLGRVRKTDPRAHAMPQTNSNTVAKREGTASGQPIRPWADPSSLPVNFGPSDMPSDDIDGN